MTSVVDYKANDSIVFTHGNEVYMYGKGVVQFDGMELNADQIEMNMDSSLVYAVGRPDSVGDIVGRPVFKDKSGEYESETMNYNFKKGIYYQYCHPTRRRLLDRWTNKKNGE